MAALAVGEAAPWAAGMAVRLHALIVRTPDPEKLAAFWDGLLGASHVPYATVTDSLALGAIHLDVGQLPDEDHVVLADPDGNEFWIRG